MEDIRKTLVDSELLSDEAILFDNPSFDSAIIGVSHDGRVVYSYDKMIECLVRSDSEETYESAAEFIDYNTLRSLPYIENSPIVVMNMDLF